jgi:type II secretory pathway component PulK
MTGEYRRIPAVREMVTVQSGKYDVNPNDASSVVLAALPRMSADTAERIVAERNKKRFADSEDFLRRVPEMNRAEALQYLNFEDQVPTVLVSTATLSSTGTSRTIRLVLRQEQKVQILSLNPLLYRWVPEVRFDRWRF